MDRFGRARIQAAIREAEAGTTGHIAVRVIPDREVDAFARAKEEFEHAALHNEPHRNASLILIAPVARKFAVLGDREMHDRVGDAFWAAVVTEMRPFFAKNDLRGGILHAIERIGRELHTYFPIPS